jgi:hypothetical protein
MAKPALALAPIAEPLLASVPEWKHVEWTVRDIRNYTTEGSLNIAPIGNRPSTVDSDGNAKNVGIIESIQTGLGISTLILRDIVGNAKLQGLYGNVAKFVVVDGGHRCRAIKWFTSFDRFSIKINGKKYRWKDLSDEQRNQIDNFKVPVSIVKCTNKQAKDIFIAYNKTTVVKPYSIIMSDEESKICEFVRKTTQSWKEYDSECHRLFKSDEDGPKYFHGTVVNKHNISDTFVFVAIHKVRGKGNVVASEHTSLELVDSVDDLSIPVKKEVNKFLDAMLMVYEYNEKAITENYFACFQAVYFQLYEQNGGKQNIDDPEKFAYKFHDAYIKLTSKNNTDRIEVEGGDLVVPKYIATNAIAFSKVPEQKMVAKLFFDEMDIIYEP